MEPMRHPTTPLLTLSGTLLHVFPCTPLFFISGTVSYGPFVIVWKSDSLGFAVSVRPRHDVGAGVRHRAGYH
jgi:hypothetical protein